MCPPQINITFMDGPLALVDSILEPGPESVQDSITLRWNAVCIFSHTSAKIILFLLKNSRLVAAHNF